MSSRREIRQQEKEAFLQQNPQLDPDHYRITPDAAEVIKVTENGQDAVFYNLGGRFVGGEYEALEIVGEGAVSNGIGGPDYVLSALTAADGGFFFSSSLTFSESGIGVTDYYRENASEVDDGFYTVEGDELIAVFDATGFTSAGFDFLIVGGTGSVVLSVYDSGSGEPDTTNVDVLNVGRSRRDGNVGEVHHLETDLPEGFDIVLLEVTGSVEVTVLGIDFSSWQGTVFDSA